MSKSINLQSTYTPTFRGLKSDKAIGSKYKNVLTEIQSYLI